jgi:hypothetical protein
MVFVILLVAAVGFYLMFMKKKGPRRIASHMGDRREELIDLLKDKKIGNHEKFVREYTEIDKKCSYRGPVPLPEDLAKMSPEDFKILNDCGAVRASLNSWAISAWAENAVVKTFDNLKGTMECVSKFSLTNETFNNFLALVKACFPPSPATLYGSYGNGNNTGGNNIGVYGSPYGIYGLPLVSPSGAGWRPQNYFNFNSQGSELLDGTDVLMTSNGNYVNAGQLQGYQLPRLGFGPYMSRTEIDAEVLPRYEPSQWIVNNGPVRPWEPRYPIMTIPPTPIPLLGTSNM